MLMTAGRLLLGLAVTARLPPGPADDVGGHPPALQMARLQLVVMTGNATRGAGGASHRPWRHLDAPYYILHR
jgi:hypothetical protein